jgi:hypothetical protein
MQALSWADDGTPIFGEPLPDGPHVVTGTPPERPGIPKTGAGDDSDALHADENAVRAFVEQFLEAAGNYDIEAMAGMFVEKANIGAVSRRDNPPRVTTYTIEEFLALVSARPNPSLYEEPVSHFTVHVEPGGMAFVRAEATLIRDGRPRSRNMDYFTLIRQNGTWKFLSASYVATPVEQE